MTEIKFDSYETLSDAAAQLILEVIDGNPAAHLCLATGASPTGAYRRVAEANKDLQSITVSKLDEWIGLSSGHPGSCETYLRREVLTPWGIDEHRYVAFDADAANPDKECERVENELDQLPTHDLCVLGIGANGHIAMNEPASELSLTCHVATLAEQSLSYPMIEGSQVTQGMTLGVGNIFRFKTVLLIAYGAGKAPAMEALRSGTVTTQWPATLLHVHPGAICLSFV